MEHSCKLINSQDLSHDVRFDLIRVTACLAVILLHVSARPIYLHMEGGANHDWWLIAIAINSATRWCVPVFVMLSGALLLGRDLPWRDTYLRRLPRMLVVLATATVIYAGWQIGFTHEFTGPSFLLSLYQGQPYYHLYFFFVVIGLYAIAPVISRFFAQVDRTTAMGAIIVACLVASASFTLSGFAPTAFTFSWPYIGYFALGFYLFRYRPELPYAWIALGSYVVTFAAVEAFALMKGPGWTWTLYPHTYFSPNVFAFSLGIFGMLLSMQVGNRMAKVFAVLAPLTLIAYIVHPMIMEFLRWTFSVHMPELMRLRYEPPLTYGLTVGISFGAAYVLRRIPVVRRYF